MGIDGERVLCRVHDQQRKRGRALQFVVGQPVDEHLEQAGVGALHGGTGNEQQVGTDR
jgi:hypothetical protein